MATAGKCGNRVPNAAESHADRLAAAPQHPVELADGREKVVARVLAAATSFGAEPAVLMVGGVPVALLRTREAGDGTGFDDCANETQIRRGLAGHDAAGRVAGVGAVEAETNAANHLPHVVLGEIGVGTTRTAGGTIEALGDTAQERVTIEARRLWVRLNDLSKGHVSPFVRAAATATAGDSFRRLERAETFDTRDFPSLATLHGWQPSKPLGRVRRPHTATCAVVACFTNLTVTAQENLSSLS